MVQRRAMRANSCVPLFIPDVTHPLGRYARRVTAVWVQLFLIFCTKKMNLLLPTSLHLQLVRY